MNSVQNVISFKAANQMKLRQNQPAPQVPVNVPQGDTFTPSFKGAQTKVVEKTVETVGNKIPKSSGVKKFFKALALATVLATSAVGFTSCEKERIEVNVAEGDVTVNIDIDNSMITALLQALADQDAARWAALMAQLAETNHLLSANNEMMGQVIQILLQHGAKLDEIMGILGDGFAALAGDNQEIKAILISLVDAVNTNNQLAQQNNELAQANNDLLTRILANALAMRSENNAANAAMIALMNYMIGQIGDLTAQQANQFADLMATLNTMDQNRSNEAAAILNAIQDLDLDVQAGVAALLAKADELNNADQARFLQWMARFDQFDADLQAGIAGLGDAINTLTVSQRQGVMMLLAKMNSMTAQLKAKMNQILAKMADMDANQQAAYAQILAKMGDLETAGQTAMADLLNKMDTIIANQNGHSVQFGQIIANQGTQIQQLATIIDKIESGNMDLTAIRNLLNNLNLQFPELDLSAIETLLSQILARENANGDMLNNINNNTQLVTAAVNALKAEVDTLRMNVAAFSQQNHDDLMAILNAIPTDISSCNCDCARIIELLVEISNKLSNGDYNHEGIRDDYDDILG